MPGTQSPAGDQSEGMVGSSLDSVSSGKRAQQGGVGAHYCFSISSAVVHALTLLMSSSGLHC